MYIDGELTEKAKLPASFAKRRHELFWKYLLPEGKHTATFKWLNPQKGASINLSEMVIYGER